jgi:hypothetical protein
MGNSIADAFSDGYLPVVCLAFLLIEPDERGLFFFSQITDAILFDLLNDLSKQLVIRISV